ncbi:unnamed protein product [Phyllotreta striolata]|uniref:Cytohesin Ubiquitin Protein Inducing domain-containing protein n=1 Tax=Phyllotreta striolata TaxID=444603 RepID=A0A9N9XK49_PHYSR|nr:unnamed protein product [Phyllotreta striolata]
MGATKNTSPRLIVLQERKKQIEETLNKRNQELRQLCIQEAELTGITPPEMPLEPGETLPHIRRRVGTSYQLPERLIKNASNKDELIADLELQIQLHANLAEAALGLANEQNISKTIKKRHKSEYEKHKGQYLVLQNQLAELKQKAAIEQQKQLKRKTRTSETSDDTVSISTSTNGKPDLRHSISSLKPASLPMDGVELRYPHESSRYRMTEVPCLLQNTNKSEEFLSNGFYRLSLNGYSKYMERRENINNVYPPYLSHHQYQYGYVPMQHLQHQQYQQPNATMQHGPLSPRSPHSSPHSSQRSPHKLYQHPQYASEFAETNRSSPASPVSAKSHYYLSHSTLNRQSCRYDGELVYRNSHQIQPHQRYEQTSGLGGYWKTMSNGEQVWYSSNILDNAWQRDRRFGSLDRRKSKRLTSRLSSNIDNKSKSATLSAIPNSQGQIRSASIKSSQALSRRSQDNGQLVRTQSLGSVGATTFESVYPTDDSSSYGSDSRSLESNQKKHKEKEWLETSLDGPVAAAMSPNSPQPSLSSSISAFSLEDKSPKEIPAESNPSKIKEPNLELFNNNMPKNCTVVQAGHCKPYHEETKPFEMSDFYKYSTKFKKSPTKGEGERPSNGRNLNKKFDECYSPGFQHHSGSGGAPSLDNSMSLNASLNLEQLTVSENFSDEMNAWYKEQRQNNNSGTSSKSRSTATLV